MSRPRHRAPTATPSRSTERRRQAMWFLGAFCTVLLMAALIAFLSSVPEGGSGGRAAEAPVGGGGAATSGLPLG